MYMRRCLQLAANGIQGARPNPMVGAVIVAAPQQGRLEGSIIGEGYHVRCGEGHAEVNAFASVRPKDEPLLRGATIYVSLEPCAHYGKTPPCAELIIKKGVKRVVVGCIDPFAKVQGKGVEMIRKAGIEVTVGVLEEECQWLNRRFFTYHSKHRPYIILKWAQTANGFMDDHFQSIMISNEQTQMLSHKLRAEEDAILVGHTTYDREHPQLNVRHWHGPDPKRIVLTHDRPLPQLMDDLYQHQIQSLIVEGGDRLTRLSSKPVFGMRYVWRPTMRSLSRRVQKRLSYQPRRKYYVNSNMVRIPSFPTEISRNLTPFLSFPLDNRVTPLVRL